MRARPITGSTCLLAVALATAVLNTSGCGRRESAVAQGVRTQTLLVGNSAEPGDLDPHLAAILSDQVIVNTLFEGLTILDERTTLPLPAVAESWQTSTDGLTWTFRLRANLQWSNGDPLTAENFILSWHRVLSPEFASDNASYLFALKNAEAFNARTLTDRTLLGCRAPDARTLILTLERPAPYLPALVSLPAWFPINPRNLATFGPLEKRGSAWTRAGNLVSNGAFTLAEWTPNARIRLTRNPRHRDAANNNLQQVTFFPIESADVEERNFRAGQLHVTANLPVSKIATWRETDPSRLRMEPIAQTNFLRFNTSRPPFSDPRIRRALALAIDRPALARAVFQGSRPPAHAFTPPGTGGYTSPASIGLDLAAARDLLAAAGHPGGKDLPVLELQCRQDESSPRLAEALQAMWQSTLGIRTTLAPYEQKIWIQNQQSLNYTLTTASWTADFPDPVTFLGLMSATSGYNWTGWNHPPYDALLNSAAQATDSTQRFALFQQAEALLLHEAPITPLFFGARTYLIDPSVQGWEPAPLIFRRFQIIQLAPKP